MFVQRYLTEGAVATETRPPLLC